MPPINGRYYMNPQHGAAMERARQAEEGKGERILGVLEDVLRELLRPHQRQAFGHGGSGSFLPDPENPWGTPPGPYSPPWVPPDPGNRYDPEEPLGTLPNPQYLSQALPAHGPGIAEVAFHGAAQHDDQAQDETDGHWVTINHRHVFIQEPAGTGRKHHKQSAAKPLPASGEASIYSDIFDGLQTSNGDTFDQKGYTAALLPRSRWHAVRLGTRVELTHDGKSIVVEINDRGAGDRNPNSTRALDLSHAAASALVGRDIKDDEDAKKVGLIHLDEIKIVPKDTPLGPVDHGKSE